MIGRSEFVGRGDELVHLRELSTAVARGDGAVAVAAVVGPAGIGKTRLLDEVAGAARTDGFEVHRATCWRGPGRPGLWPWIQVAHSLVTTVTPAAGAPLRRLLTGPASQKDGAGDRFALVAELVHLAQQAASGHPQLLVIDDLHDADDASLEMLEFVVNQLHGHRILLIGAFRPADAAAHERSGSIGTAFRDAAITSLGGFGPAETHRLVTEAGVDLDQSVVTEIHAASEGNPFYALQMARSLASMGTTALSEVPLPPTVLDSIRRHLALATPSVRRILDAAAVQGPVFDPATAAAAASCAVDEARDALRRAAELGFLVPTPPHDHFAHGLVVETLLRDLDLDQRRRLHLATADALERFASASTTAQVASHLAEAGPLVAASRLIESCRAAAESARRSFSPAEASRYLRVAADAIDQTADPGQAIDCQLELCEAAKAARDLDLARAAAGRAAQLAREAGDDVGLARAAIAMPPEAELIEVDHLADPDQIALREEALARLPGDDRVASRLMASLAMSLYWAQRTGDQALDHRATAERRDQLTATALERARGSDDPATLAFCVSARLYAMWGPDAPVDRRRLVAELGDLARAAGDGTRELEALTWAIVDALVTGDHQRATVGVAHHHRLAERRHDSVHRWTSLRWQAGLALLEGRFEDARAHAAVALELGSALIDPVAAFDFYAVQIGLLDFLDGRLGEAYDYLRQAADDPRNVPSWRCGFVLAAVEAGDLDTARRELAVLAAERFRALPRDLDWLGGLVTLAPAVHALGDVEAARVLLELLEPHAEHQVVVGLGYVCYGPVRRALALLEMTLGNHDAAVTHMRTAVDSLDPAQRVWQVVCGLSLAEALAGRGRPGDRAEAQACGEEARAEALACGLEHLAAVAASTLDRLGQRGVARLREAGSHWVVAGPDGLESSVRPLRGLALLAELLRTGREMHALDLVWAVDPPGDGEVELRRAVAAERGEELLDREASVAIARRVVELEAELDSADRRGDVSRSQALTREVEAIRDELRRATGIGGRRRRAPDAAERARVSVTKLLQRAIGAIADVNPALGAHLERSVRTGTRCAYAPPPDERLDWDLDWPDRPSPRRPADEAESR